MGFLNKKPSAVGISDSFRFKIGPPFSGSISFLSGNRYPSKPVGHVLDTLTRQVAKVGLHFCNQGNFGEKIPMGNVGRKGKYRYS